MDFIFSQALGPIKFALVNSAITANKNVLNSKTIPSCKKGCSNCCYRLIHVLTAEAVLIYEYLKDKKQWKVVRERSLEQFSLLKDSPHPVAWFKMGKFCPVLDPKSNTCLAYPVRPIACAVHYTLSNPKTCSPYYTGKEIYNSLDFIDLYTEFRNTVHNSIAGFGILTLELSLPIALLLSERISIQSNITLEKAISLILNEL